MTHRKPRATVLDVHASGDLYQVTIELESQRSRPLAPASLYRDDEPAVVLAELHRLISVEGLKASFESFVQEIPPLAPGDRVVFYPWWTFDQLCLAQDVKRAWQKAHFAPRNAIKYMKDGSRIDVPGGWDHEHCRLCWATIRETTPFAYLFGKEWLCDDCYRRYIETGFGKKLGDMV